MLNDLSITIILLILIAIFIFVILYKKSKNSSHLQKNIEKNQSNDVSNTYEIDLTSFPDRTDSIIFHKNNLLKAIQSNNVEQANLSFAKLVESYRQQNINENGNLENEYQNIRHCYDKFREILKLDYPKEFCSNKEISTKIESKNKGYAIIKINHESYLTQYKDSPNQQYTLYWEEGKETASNKIVTNCFLFKQDKYISKRKVNFTINNCSVSNIGNFAIDCYIPGSNDLKHTLYAFSETKKLLEKKFNASIYSVSISENGNYVVCQTCNSDNDDGNTISFFNLESKKMLWKITGEIFWTFKHIIDIDNKKIWFIDDEYGEFAYDFEGNFIDKDKYLIECRKRASPWQVCDEAKELLKTILESDIEKKDSIIDKVYELTEEAFLKLELNPDVNTESIAYRLRGEIAELRQDKDEAIKMYEKALALNPKVGVKMRLKKLKNE